MPERNNVTVAIYPNHRGMGYVICSHPGEIIDYGVGYMRRLAPNHYIKRLQRFIRTYSPNVVLIKEYRTRGTVVGDRVRKVIDRLEGEAIGQDLKVFRYSRSQVREVFAPFGGVDKFSISRTLARWHPELSRFLAPKRTFIDPEDYYMGLFDAFALVHAHFALSVPKPKKKDEG